MMIAYRLFQRKSIAFCKIASSRNVCTSIAATFNKLQNNIPQTKWFNVRATTGLFGYDQLRDPSGFYLNRENAIIQSDNLVKKIVNDTRNDKMVEMFDQLSNCLCKVADLAEFVRMGHPQQRFKSAAEQTSMAISAEVEKLNTHKELYHALRKVVEEGDRFKTTEIDDHVAKLFLFDFEQSGIHLSESERKLVVELNDYILHVSSYFMNHTNAPRSVNVSKVPQEIRRYFQTDGDEIIVNSLHINSPNSLVRESAYRIFLFPDKHQETLLSNLLNSRKKLAKLCGFKSFAERAIKGSIADTPENVMDFLIQLSEKLFPLAEADFKDLLKFKKQLDPSTKLLHPWDVPFYTATFKQNRFSSCIASCSPYFSLGTCMDGLNMIFTEIYGTEFEVCEIDDGEVWHSDVVKLRLNDKSNDETLGYLYCDYFERPTKPQQDCHFTIQGGCNLQSGEYQLPIVVLNLSLPCPSASSPSLLSPHMVDNLFHEMGHAMHSMLARTPYQHITGTRCSTDLAEVPSILMEYFSNDARVISKFAKHYSTDEKMPSDLLNLWLDSKKTFKASETQLQVFYSVLDQVYHSEDPFMGKSNSSEVLAEIQNRFYIMPYTQNTAWQLRFGHLVGYGAKYYAYLVSRSVAHLIWDKVFANDPLSRSAGNFYRENVLCYGGGKPPREIVEAVLEKTLSSEMLANAIVKDLS